MSVSIDGKVHNTYLDVKYGFDFPSRYSNMEIKLLNYGRVLIYVTEVGTPEWTDKMSVKVRVWYYITQVLDDKKKAKRVNNLKLVKG